VTFVTLFFSRLCGVFKNDFQRVYKEINEKVSQRLLKGEKMDFYQIKERTSKNKTIEIYPDFKVARSKDLMVRGRSFYAIWNEETGLWSTDEYDVQRLVDKELLEYKNRLSEQTENPIHVKYMSDYSTNTWQSYRNYIYHLSDNAHQLDTCLTFLNTDVKKKDYVSRRLPYSLERGECPAYDELMSMLYNSEERDKLEWAIGAIVAGEAKDIQKFIVLYGTAGSGKSTFLNIVQKLFPGYYTTFEAKALTGSNNTFSTEVFRSNPLVALQHDGDLSRIEDNTKLNSIVSHEEMTMNEKYKPSYTARANCFLFMATNKPVKISDAKAGIIRRLIDVHPSGRKFPINKYYTLISRIEFELGAIAYKCMELYWKLGKNYYSNYRPLDMIFQTDVFFNFVESYFDTFVEQGGASLSQAYDMYKRYCDDALVEFKLPRHKFREELKNYFENFDEITRIDGRQVRSYYSKLITSKFTAKEISSSEDINVSWITLDSTTSIFNVIGEEFPAQYASSKYETPSRPWSKISTKLKDIDTRKLHYVKVPVNHIVIDFDIKDLDGNKSLDRNIDAASRWPPTYAEYSRSQSGIHLHYIYEGDTSKLSNVYAEGIEVKVFQGDAALRRKFTKCNTISINSINSGLPLKGEKMINFDVVKSERGIRDLIKRNLLKEFHPGTKPSIDFIYTILEEAYNSGLKYDVRDMRQKILVFANNSTNHPDYCLRLVEKMHFQSEEPSENAEKYSNDSLVFFDVEVFPNLFVVSWKYEGDNNECVHLINPTSQEIEELMKMKLVGFNCRRYDNHILYARYIGYTLKELFDLSQRIIVDNNKSSFFGEAYNISFADVYDFISEKKSLKKFEIELHIHHQELGFPFDQEVKEEDIPAVVDYCDNDVLATEAVFHNRKEDFIARQILADLSGLTVNDSTQSHTAKIIFGNDPRPQEKFNYVNLEETFPGYKFESGKSFYRGEEIGEGGYVYAEPGFYRDVALLDVASMHPTSIEILNLFGPYTKNYSEIIAARLAIKHKDFDSARKMLNGCLNKYLTSTAGAVELAYALKIIINIVYGLTAAKFSNKFRDTRNVDNIVAKRGSLFMKNLKDAVQEKGFKVAHIKTDSIKIPEANGEIIDFVFEFGKKYGYTFEHEGTLDKFCLVNDAVYIAKYSGKETGKWVAVGAQFQHPYVFKTLFTPDDEITFYDLCETKSVTTGLYLDMNESLPEGEHNYIFVGKTGSFCPIKAGYGGGLLMREKDGKYYAASGSKGYRWLEAEVVKNLGKEDSIDKMYHENLVDEALAAIEEYIKKDEFFDD
jgi:energy-coupling factor transporter ATP-binding protein EcfA2